METRDVAIIGGGLVGMATALALLERRRRSLIVLEAEPALAAHQSGHNSGVIHSGLYYGPGSLKARLCIEGREALVAYCRRRGIEVEVCGKLVVAADPDEAVRLRALADRGRTNGLDGLRLLERGQWRDIEPHVAGHAALLVPQTGLVDFAAVNRALAGDVQERGGAVVTGARVIDATRRGAQWILETAQGAIGCRLLVACAGLQSDRVAALCGLPRRCRIVPFRGAFWKLADDRRHLVRNPVYPVPDPGLPFLGVHFTRRLDGEVEVGPTALVALDRHGYEPWRVRWRDARQVLGYPGFWALAGRRWRSALGEVLRSSSRHALARALRRMVPELRPADLLPARAGVRAQALDLRGRLIDDFVIAEGPGTVHVINAPSPAATACLAIGRAVAERVDGIEPLSDRAARRFGQSP